MRMIMGIFDNKAELQNRLIEIEKDLAVKNELLSQKGEEIEHLRKQVDRLQNAVLAVHHPEAYRSVRDDEFAAEAAIEPIGEEKRKETKEENDIIKNHIENMEGPLFKDVEDMMDLLGKRVGIPVESSVHDNDES